MGISAQALNQFAKELNQQKQELLRLAEVGAQAADTVELDQQRVGRVSRMDALQSQAMSIETNRRREIELQRIDSALFRLQEGSYGICVSCDEDIAIARLKADPANPVCIDCARRSAS